VVVEASVDQNLSWQFRSCSLTY